MPRTTRLIASPPYWVLLIGSLAATAAGLAMTFPTIANMSATLQDGSATTTDVYAGQALVTVGGPVLAAGLIGLALAAALAAVKAAVPAAAAAPHDAPVEDDIEQGGSEPAARVEPDEVAEADEQRPNDRSDIAPAATETGHTA